MAFSVLCFISEGASLRTATVVLVKRLITL